VCDLETSRVGAPYIYDISNLRVKFSANLAESKHAAQKFEWRDLISGP